MKKLKIDNKNVLLTNSADEKPVTKSHQREAHLIIKDGEIVKNHTDFSEEEIEDIIEDNIQDAVHPINQGQL